MKHMYGNPCKRIISPAIEYVKVVIARGREFPYAPTSYGVSVRFGGSRVTNETEEQNGGNTMTDLSLEEKLKKATGVICKQGMFPFPLSETAITIIRRVVKGEEELDLICAFNEASSQTMDQLKQTVAFPRKPSKNSPTVLPKRVCSSTSQVLRA